MIDKDFVAYTEFGNSENTIHWYQKQTISKRQRIDKEFLQQFAFSSFSSPMKPIYHQGN
jgi:hypothetical protein